MKEIGSGAEAVIYADKDIVRKERIEKDYRIKELDVPLRKSRTRREAKVLQKVSLAGIPVPKVLKVDDKKMTIDMEHIKGDRLSKVFEKKDYKRYSKEMALIVKKLHKNDIIHSDLTTSNFVLDKKGKLFIIDFGLSFFSRRVEDKAVDLHLLKRALDSKHYKVADECFKIVLKTYKDKEVIERLKKVELRGRNKQK